MKFLHIAIFSLSTFGVEWKNMLGTGFDMIFREQFNFVAIVKQVTVDGVVYYDANPLLLAISLSAISYVIIIGKIMKCITVLLSLQAYVTSRSSAFT